MIVPFRYCLRIPLSFVMKMFAYKFKITWVFCFGTRPALNEWQVNRAQWSTQVPRTFPSSLPTQLRLAPNFQSSCLISWVLGYQVFASIITRSFAVCTLDNMSMKSWACPVFLSRIFTKLSLKVVSNHCEFIFVYGVFYRPTSLLLVDTQFPWYYLLKMS